jgi:hypothetical protein
MTNWKERVRRRSWPSLRYYHGICVEGLRTTTKELQLGLPVSGPIFEPGTSRYEPGVLTLGRDVRHDAL